MRIVIVTTFMALFFIGCGEKTIEDLPEVNDENCKHENILKIKNKKLQQEYSGLCLRRSSFRSKITGGSNKSWTIRGPVEEE